MARKIVNIFVFVCLIAGVVFYGNYVESSKVTHEEAIVITQEIVKTHTPLILKDLGVKDDGVSSRINIQDSYPNDGYSGVCHYKYVTINGTKIYKQKSAVIDLFPMVYLQRQDNNGNLVPLSLSLRPSKDEFRKKMIETLAHELRHYWQCQTGEIFKYVYDTSIPHDERWAEIDANNYMKKYYQSIKD